MSEEVARVVRERQLAEMSAARQRAEQKQYWGDLADGELLKEIIRVDETIQWYEKIIQALRQTKRVGWDEARSRGLADGT